MLVSIVIPCYNSEHTIREVVELTMAQFDEMGGYECEFVLVNDSSSDDTFGEIRRLGFDYPNVHGINLMRNFGQHNGLMCGMNFAEGDYVIGMDDDLQTHPSQIPVILGKMEEGYDLVYGVYRESTNGAAKNFTSWFNRVSSRTLLGRPKDIRSSNFWCITKGVRDEVVRCKSFNPYVDGLFYRTTHNIGNVTIEHHKREYGSSGYTLRKMAKLWVAYFNYSVVPLRVASIIGLATSIVGFVAGIVTIIRKLIDPTMIMGWTSTVCIMLFFFGLVLLVLGIIGEYIGDIVLSINSSPQYIVRDKVNL
ncbi:MAG: glycosyltransferase family 2 protein [Atopobiaceae bacterium]|nr:glycosyltransferase family 2 protein [Atopobiaceae bacterium]